MSIRAKLTLTALAITAVLLTKASAATAVVRYPSPLDANLYTICWTGTQFVAAGQGGAILTSPDGMIWTARQSPLASGWLASAVGGGQIVLTGDEAGCATSSDGITWTARNLPAPYPSKIGSVGWNGSVFAATDSWGSDTFFSPTGAAWTRQATTADNWLRGLALNEETFASFDAGLNSPVHMQKLWTTAGGEWSSVQTNTTGMQDIVWTGARYVAVGKGGVAATSTDGVTWTPRTTGVLGDLRRVIWTGTQAVTAGSAGTIITSPNGATWTPQASGTTRDLTSVAFSGNRLVAVGMGGVVLTSPDGAAWSNARTGTDLVKPVAVGWTGTSGIAVGKGGTLISGDGLTWTRTAAVGGPYSAGSIGNPRFRLAAGAGRIVAACEDGVWSCPSDGSSWSKVPSWAVGVGVVRAGDEFLALYREPRYDGGFYTDRISSSPDGVNWGMVHDFSVPQFGDIAWTGQRYVYDSFNWIFWTGNQLVGVSATMGIFTSSNGSEWKTALPPVAYDAFMDVTWSGSRLLAATGYNGIYESTLNGPWKMVHSGRGDSIAWTGTRALVANGSEIYSLEGIGFSPWQQWLAAHFNAAQMNIPAITGPLGNADGDAFPNLVEYSMGADPASRDDPPVITVLPASPGSGARFRWPQDTGRNDVIVTPQTSFDLDIWDNTTGTPVSGPAGGMRILETPPISSQRKVYFRLNVELKE